MIIGIVAFIAYVIYVMFIRKDDYIDPAHIREESSADNLKK